MNRIKNIKGMGKVFICMALFTGIIVSVYAKELTILSPDRQIAVHVSTGHKIHWTVKFQGKTILEPSALSLRLAGSRTLGIGSTLKRTGLKAVNERIDAIVPVKEKVVIDQYNELKLEFKEGFALYFRAYNDGVAYRFETNLPDKELLVEGEQVDLHFPANYRVFWPKEADKEFQSHFESLYADSLISDFTPEEHGALPMLLQTADGVDLLVSESDLYDYPNLFLFGTGRPALTAGFPKVILGSQPVRDRGIKITKLADYIAKTSGKRTFPWRSIAIAANDMDLLKNNLTYKLASANCLVETDWIKPGQVAWDWWNDNNIYGVDFKAGINTETYKYYVDFAAKFGLEYIMLDEGWTRTTTDLLHPTAEIDIKGLIDYAASKNIGVWLWCLWGPLDKDMEAILDQYAAWGAKGIKVDFMARADQYMVNFYERVAKECAKRKLMVDLHGAYKPVGLNRTYPNVLNYEGVRGGENNKWERTITPKHNTTLPFIRMAAGPMDYTPGAMNNVIEKNFNPVFSEPMSMGTRAHQVAMFTLFESPLQMLADNPSNYLRDSLCTAFIAQIPTTWDETVPLEGKVGEYVAVARRKGPIWYIAAMTDWNSRTLQVPVPFLNQKRYRMQILKDGKNADRHAADYKVEQAVFPGGAVPTITIPLESGGGWSAILTPDTH